MDICRGGKYSVNMFIAYMVFKKPISSPFFKGVIFTLRNFIAYYSVNYSVNLFSPITPFIFNPLKNFSKEEQL